MRDIVADSIERILAGSCPSEVVRAIEGGSRDQALWKELESSGFLDALVAESAGGSGLSLADASPLIEAAGRYAVPVPFAETVVLRWLLAAAGAAPPSGSLTFGRAALAVAGGVSCANVPLGSVADWVLVADGSQWALLPGSVAAQDVSGFALGSTMTWRDSDWCDARRISTTVDLQLAEALVRALQLSGALLVVLERTIAYASERKQFGKSIGKFQVIQHQITVMAEQVLAARMAAELAVATPGQSLDPLRIAIAKARTSEAAAEVAALAHAIHGAIGFTIEFDLHLWTRRLHAWRQAAGSEGLWHDRVGTAVLEPRYVHSVDLLRRVSAPASA